MRWVWMCLMLFVAACRTEQQPDDCDPNRWEYLIGQSSKAAEEVPEPKRIIPPNSAVTQDYRLDRTNVDLDGSGVIVRVWCG